MKYFLVLLTAIFFTTLTFSQDTIFKRNGNQLKGKVVEVGTSEIKYKLPDNMDGPLYAVDKNLVSKIIYENGRIENFVNDIKQGFVKNFYKSGKTNCFPAPALL